MVTIFSINFHFQKPKPVFENSPHNIDPIISKCFMPHLLLNEAYFISHISSAQKLDNQILLILCLLSLEFNN